MKSTPLISIVMPVYNAQTYLADSVNSVLEQSFKSFELIIINDGSTDNSLDILDNYSDKRIQVINNEHDFINSLNIGMTRARGQYIARMDADDIMLSDRLKIQFEFMESHPEIDICGGWLEAFGEGERKNVPAADPWRYCINHAVALPSLPSDYYDEKKDN